jgi:hypothetical protein
MQHRRHGAAIVGTMTKLNDHVKLLCVRRQVARVQRAGLRTH